MSAFARPEKGESICVIPEALEKQNQSCRFPLDQIVATPGALEALDRAAINAADLIQRHQFGDWGNVPPGDAEENMQSIENGWRILSSYPLSDDQNIWIITEADRSVTTLLLPEEC